MHILVTGAAGFIGSHLTERLLASGHWSRFHEVRGDIRDADSYRRVPEVEAVIHLAARAGVRPSIADPMLYMDVNLNGTMRLLEFMKGRKIPTLVFGSSSSVHGDSAPVPLREDDPADRPISPYAATRRAGELLVHSHCHLFGLEALCLRFFTVFGPRQRPDLAIHKFALMLSHDEEIPIGARSRIYPRRNACLDTDPACPSTRESVGSPRGSSRSGTPGNWWRVADSPL